MFTNEQEALNEHSDDTFLIAYNVNNLPLASVFIVNLLITC
jgi:hypothetical protein